MPTNFDEQGFIRIPIERIRAQAQGISSFVRRWDGVLVPQDNPQPPLPPLTEAEKEVASLLEVVRDEQLRRWAKDLSFLTPEEQDDLVLKEFRRKKDSGILQHI